jgi:hypothetical protein
MKKTKTRTAAELALIDIQTFEMVLDGEFFVADADKTRQEFRYADVWAERLERRGFVLFENAKGIISVTRNAKLYTPTPAGLEWWYRVRIEAANEPPNAANLLREFEGKGIGAIVNLYVFPGNADFIVALRDGLLEMVSHHAAEFCSYETLTVKQTAAGMAFFDSIPRLELECA